MVGASRRPLPRVMNAHLSSYLDLVCRRTSRYIFAAVPSQRSSSSSAVHSFAFFRIISFVSLVSFRSTQRGAQPWHQKTSCDGGVCVYIWFQNNGDERDARGETVCRTVRARRRRRRRRGLTVEVRRGEGEGGGFASGRVVPCQSPAVLVLNQQA